MGGLFFSVLSVIYLPPSILMRPQIKQMQRTFQISLFLSSTYLFDFSMFEASSFIVMVKFFLCISFEKDRKKGKKKVRKNRSSEIEINFLRKNIEP